ncbi:MAG: hypothetical protein QW465_00160 [Candidatus Anstonellales archaeon]
MIIFLAVLLISFSYGSCNVNTEQEMIQALNSCNLILAENNIELTQQINIENRDIIIDMNGFSLTSSAGVHLNIDNSNITIQNMKGFSNLDLLLSSGELYIKNSEIYVNNNNKFQIRQFGKLYIQNLSILGDGSDIAEYRFIFGRGDLEAYNLKIDGITATSENYVPYGIIQLPSLVNATFVNSSFTNIRAFYSIFYLGGAGGYVENFTLEGSIFENTGGRILEVAVVDESSICRISNFRIANNVFNNFFTENSIGLMNFIGTSIYIECSSSDISFTIIANNSIVGNLFNTSECSTALYFNAFEQFADNVISNNSFYYDDITCGRRPNRVINLIDYESIIVRNRIENNLIRINSDDEFLYLFQNNYAKLFAENYISNNSLFNSSIYITSEQFINNTIAENIISSKRGIELVRPSVFVLSIGPFSDSYGCIDNIISGNVFNVESDAISINCDVLKNLNITRNVFYQLDTRIDIRSMISINIDQFLEEEFMNNIIYDNIFNITPGLDKYSITIRGAGFNNFYDPYSGCLESLEQETARLININITKTPGRSIVNSINLGGNYWADHMGGGFSETCSDSDNDQICDQRFDLYKYLYDDDISCRFGSDYYPLTLGSRAGSPPDVNITSPQNGTEIESRAVDLFFDIWDDGDRVTYEIYVNGELDSRREVIFEYEGYHIRHIIIGLPYEIGQSTPVNIEVRVYDEDGNTASDSITIYVNYDPYPPPRIGIITNNPYYLNNPIIVSYNISTRSNFGLYEYDVVLVNLNDNNYQIIRTHQFDSYPTFYNNTIDLSPYISSPGNYRIIIEAYDEIGIGAENSSDIVVLAPEADDNNIPRPSSRRVDYNSPRVEIEQISNTNISGSINISIPYRIIADRYIDYYEIFLNSTLYENVSWRVSEYVNGVLLLKNLGEGTYLVEIRAYDIDGRYGNNHTSFRLILVREDLDNKSLNIIPTKPGTYIIPTNNYNLDDGDSSVPKIQQPENRVPSTPKPEQPDYGQQDIDKNILSNTENPITNIPVQIIILIVFAPISALLILSRVLRYSLVIRDEKTIIKVRNILGSPMKGIRIEGFDVASDQNGVIILNVPIDKVKFKGLWITIRDRA